MDKTILVVDDDEGIRDYVKELLMDNGFLVKDTDTGTKALNLVEKLNPELVLLDLVLPDIPGEEVCKKIKEIYPEVSVVMLTSKDSAGDLAEGLNAGADDYIKKPFEEKELLARVRARLREGYSSSSILRIGDLVLDQKKFEVKRGGNRIELTPQEFKLLEYLMLNKNQVLSRERILNRVWQQSPEVKSRVVDVYIGYLRKKIDSGFEKELVRSVRGFGYTIKE